MRLGTSLCLAMLACWPYAAYGQQQPPPAQQEAEWTVMAWMNGDNDLQDYIVNDWKEMAWVGSGDAVNIVVQLDQKDKDDTYTFRVASEKDNDPVLQPADRTTEANMVSGAELAAFIAQTRKRYPAKRYALLFSSHGTGWREFKVAQPSVPPSAAAEAALPDDDEDESEILPPPRFLPGGLFGSPNRSVNSDDNSPDDALYNVEIADALALGMDNKPLDLVVFDACLMGMVEVAFGLRKTGRVLVASEELVSGHGFNHSTWLRQLRDTPAIDGAALGKLLVRSYDVVHARRLDPGRTLSAFDLGVAGELARAVSALSEALIADIEGQRKAIRKARRNCAVYAAKGCDFGARDCVFHVDLKRFTDELARLTTSEEVCHLARRVGFVLKKGIIDNYAGPERRDARFPDEQRSGASCEDLLVDGVADPEYGSYGLAIYFPAQPNDFLHDHLQQKAYLKANRDFPVEFVSKATWADFLHVYHLGTREATPCPEP